MSGPFEGTKKEILKLISEDTYYMYMVLGIFFLGYLKFSIKCEAVQWLPPRKQSNGKSKLSTTFAKHTSPFKWVKIYLQAGCTGSLGSPLSHILPLPHLATYWLPGCPLDMPKTSASGSATSVSSIPLPTTLFS